MEALERRVLLSSGMLDPTFGGGVVITPFNSGVISASAQAVAVQANGKVVAAGTANQQFALARYNRDGTLDSSFGTGGKVQGTGLFGAQINALAIQSDGQIVAAGIQGFGQFTVARYNPDGSLDTSFGQSGFAVPDFHSTFSRALAVVIQPDGRIVAAGQAQGQNGGRRDIALARLNPDGTPDPTFGTPAPGFFATPGIVTTDVAGGTDLARALALEPDGRILVGGFAVANGRRDFAILRYNTNGTIDPSFGTNGIVLSTFGGADTVRSLALQSDASIIAGGVNGGSFLLARYAPNGTLDPAFGVNGVVTSPFAGGSADLDTVLVEPDDSIITAGTFAAQSFALARFLPAGALDTTFGVGGTILTGIGPGTAAHDAAFTPEGNVVVAGETARRLNFRTSFAVARYLVAPAIVPGISPLVVTGTDGADTISLSAGGGVLTVTNNGTVRTFSLADVSPISVLALGGHDTVTIGPGVGGVAVSGGAGNDTIMFADGNNAAFGGSGADRITGGSSNETLNGGPGADTISGGSGNDLIFGGAGNDSLFSRDGLADTVNGGAGTNSAQVDATLDSVSRVQTLLA